MLLRRSDALEGADIGELRVLDDDADGLGSIHGGAAADRDDHVSAGCLEGGNAVLDVLDGRVRLDLGIEAPGNLGLIEQVGDLGGHAELHEVGVGADEGLLVAATGNLARNLLDSASAVIGDGVEHETIDHETVLSKLPCTGSDQSCPKSRT